VFISITAIQKSEAFGSLLHGDGTILLTIYQVLPPVKSEKFNCTPDIGITITID